MNHEEKIRTHLELLDLDIRKTNFSRFMDQKVTPDVLCFISDCIINLSNQNDFTTKDIWESNYFEKNIRAIFGKPSPTNVNVQNEYDKFIIQPLRMLYYAGILDSKKEGQKYIYNIKNYELLDYISIKERNAYKFLFEYIVKVLNDSGLLSYFERFKDKCLKNEITKEDFEILKDKFIKFMRGHTQINQDVEIRRIFPKVLNIYASENNINGVVKGHLSKYVFNFSDLMYNRKNWRDIGKEKGISRAESIELETQQEVYTNYVIEKAKNIIKKKYTESEVKDSLANSPAVHVHHIFPMSSFPQLATYLENLIKLTATQHLQKAHPQGNTQIIDKDYQCVCLLAKSNSIEYSLTKGELIYTKPNFIYVINEGLNLNLSTSIDFIKLRTEINKEYNSI